MAVTQVKEQWEEESSRDGVVRDYTRQYWATTDDTNDRAVDVRRSSLIPQIGDLYHRDSGARVVSVRVRHHERTPFQYEVQVRYSSAAGYGSQTLVEDPFARPPRRRVFAVTRREEYERDYSTPPKATVNTAGVPLNPLPDRDRSDQVYNVVINSPTFSAATAKLYYNAVNEDIWNGIPIGEAKVMQWAGTQIFEGTLVYWEHDFEIHIRDGGWDDKKLSVGRSVRLPIPSPSPPFFGIFPIIVTDEEGNKSVATEDYVLTPDGADYLRPGSASEVTDVHYLTFQTYKRLPFAGVIPE